MARLKRYDEDDIARLAHLIGEDIEGRFKAQFEVFDDIRDKVSRIPKIETDVAELKSKMFVVEAMLTAHETDIRQLQAVAHRH